MEAVIFEVEGMARKRILAEGQRIEAAMAGQDFHHPRGGHYERAWGRLLFGTFPQVSGRWRSRDQGRRQGWDCP